MKKEFLSFKPMELDALREVGNIGAAHAATALSQIVEKTIMISVSRVNIVPIKEIANVVGDGKQKAVVVHLKVLGDIIGGILLHLNWKNAFSLVKVLHKGEGENHGEELSKMEISALKECGSILAAAYLEAIGNFIQMSLIPSVPDLSLGEIGQILNEVFIDLSKRAEMAFCIETEFIESSHKIKGNFLLIPETKSLKIMLKGLGLMPGEG